MEDKMAISEWRKDENGVILHPIVGFETAVRPTAIGVRLMLGDRSGAGGAAVGSTQLVFSAEQARALAKALMDGADHAEQSARTLVGSQSMTRN
jgi:hypothetical protein